MSCSPSTYLRLFVLLAALLLCIGPVISRSSPNDDKDDDIKNEKDDDRQDYKDVVRVKRGESIRRAIDHAKPYARIEVEGHHKEHVTINKDGISLVVKGASLSPPDRPEQNYCFGLVKDDTNPADLRNTSAGICIHGRRITLEKKYNPFALHWKVDKVDDPIKDVTVSGFEVDGFDGPNIVVYGGKDTKIHRNKLERGLRYGFLTVGSTGTEASNNIVIGSAPATLKNGPIAMCMDDLSSALFSYNDLSDYFIGLCTETSDAINRNNNIHDCCIGNFIDPNVENAKCLDNEITRWNPRCPATGAAGISLGGAKNALVKGNYIDIGIDLPVEGAGVFLGLEVEFNATNEGNTITKNKFGKNPVDIFDNSTGTNYIFGNECDLAFDNLPNPAPAPQYCS